MGILINEKKGLKLLFANDTLYHLGAAAAEKDVAMHDRETESTVKYEETRQPVESGAITNPITEQPAVTAPLHFHGKKDSGYCFLFLNDVSGFSQVTDKLAEICRAFGIDYTQTALCDLSSNNSINILELLRANGFNRIIAWGIELSPFNNLPVNQVSVIDETRILKTGLFRETMADIARKKQFADAFKKLTQ